MIFIFQNGSWVWDSGVPFTYTNWYPNFPKTFGDCLYFCLKYCQEAPKAWLDIYCNHDTIKPLCQIMI